MLEAGAVGDRLTMKWWPVGDSEPTEPQWEWADPSPLPAGVFGAQVYISADGVAATGTTPPWRIGATFDDVYFTPVPVPVSLALTSPGTFIFPLGENCPLRTFSLEATEPLTLNSAKASYTGAGPVP